MVFEGVPMRKRAARRDKTPALCVPQLAFDQQHRATLLSLVDNSPVWRHRSAANASRRVFVVADPLIDSSAQVSWRVAQFCNTCRARL